MPAAGIGEEAVAQQAPISPVPTTRDWTGVVPVQYPDPDVVALDPRFRKYMIGNTAMKKLYTGTQWAEGPAWNGVGTSPLSAVRRMRPAKLCTVS